jgi:hypothetical protein
MPKEKHPKRRYWTTVDEEKLVSESFLIYLILIFYFTCIIDFIVG